MTLVSDAATSMISEFGVTVTITSHNSQEPEDSNDPVLFQESTSTESTSEEKVRFYSAASEEVLEEHGFESDGDAIMYADDSVASEGDEVAYSGMEYIVRNTKTNQINESQGKYIWLYKLIEK